MSERYGFDANIVLSTISRRIFSAIHEHKNQTFWIAPTVREETIKKIGDRATVETTNRLKRQDPQEARWSNTDRINIGRIAAAAAEEWLAAEYEAGRQPIWNSTRSRPIMKCIEPREQDAEGVSKAWKVIRPLQFPREEDPGTNNDRAIVAECIHHRLVPIVCGNIRTIDHRELNKWASQWFRENQWTLDRNPPTAAFATWRSAGENGAQ